MSEKLQISREMRFGVPIYEVEIPEFASQQAALSQHFLSMRADSEGMHVSNQGGYHSPVDLHHSKEPCVRWLMQRIAMSGARCINHGESVPEDVKIMLASAWVNINEAGDWNAPHAHFPCHWSGVVYIDINSKEEGVVKSERDGDILFFDPLPLGPQYHRPPTVTKKPAVGKMFIFPSYVVHMVAPHFDASARISVAFNFNLEAR